MNKDKIMGIIKTTKVKITLGVLGGIIIGTAIGGATQEQKDALAQNKDLNNQIVKLQEDNTSLTKKVDEAKPFFEMQDEEKKKLEEEKKKIESEKLAKEEALKKEKEAKEMNKIGERIIFSKGDKGEFALTIDNVELTKERNQFAEKIDNVVKIQYTVENISMEELDFFLDNSGKFYDAEGIKCNSYPNSEGAGTYDIAKGKKAKGTKFIGVNGEKFLEMQLGGTIYKWDLK